MKTIGLAAGSIPSLVVCVAGAFADFVLFRVLTAHGVSWFNAHAIAFLISAPATSAVWAAWVKEDTPGKGFLWRFSGSFVVQMLALFARGGALNALVRAGGWSPQASMTAALGVSFVVGLAGLLILILSSGDPARADDDRWAVPAYALVAYGLLLRFLYGFTFEILHEEGYYWNYGNHLAMGYLDHPPLIGWVARLFTTLFGLSEFSLRVGAFAFWGIAACYAYRLARDVCGPRVAAGTLMLVTLLPYFFGAGLFLMPDAPLTACWAGSLYYFYQALIRERPRAWLAAGVFMGLGLLSKYTIALLGPALLAYMLFDRRSRRWFSRPEPYVAAGIAALLFSPVILWNYRHGWVSFLYQSADRLMGGFVFALPALLGGILVLLTPVGFLAAGVVMANRTSVPCGTDRPDSRNAGRLLLTLTWIPLAVFVLFSLGRTVKLNWTGPVWLGVLPYMAALMMPGNEGGAGKWKRRLEKGWKGTAIALLLVYGAGFHYLTLGFPGVPYPENALGIGMPDLARRVGDLAAEYKKATGEAPLTVCMYGDRLAGWITFYQAKRAGARNAAALAEIAAHTTGGQFFGMESHMYGFWHPGGRHKGRTLLVVALQRKYLEGDRVDSRARPISDIKPLVFRKNGKITGTCFYRFVKEGKNNAP